MAADLSDLSDREREVLELVAAGLSNEEIGGRLFLSTRTVERHLSNVYAKLRLSGKSAAPRPRAAVLGAARPASAARWHQPAGAPPEVADLAGHLASSGRRVHSEANSAPNSSTIAAA